VLIVEAFFGEHDADLADERRDAASEYDERHAGSPGVGGARGQAAAPAAF
jgi:hypothetical protein